MSTNKNLSARICIPLRNFCKRLFVFDFDLKSGQHHVDIFPEHRKYLAFSWEFVPGHMRFFQFIVLPFGLSSAPYIFTKLLKPLETLIMGSLIGSPHINFRGLVTTLILVPV